MNKFENDESTHFPYFKVLLLLYIIIYILLYIVLELKFYQSVMTFFFKYKTKF